MYDESMDTEYEVSTVVVEGISKEEMIRLLKLGGHTIEYVHYKEDYIMVRENG